MICDGLVSYPLFCFLGSKGFLSSTPHLFPSCCFSEYFINSFRMPLCIMPLFLMDTWFSFGFIYIYYVYAYVLNVGTHMCEWR